MTENDATTKKEVVTRKLPNGRVISSEELNEDARALLTIIEKYVVLNRPTVTALLQRTIFEARPRDTQKELWVAQTQSLLVNAWKDGI